MRDLLDKLDQILQENTQSPTTSDVKTDESGLQYYTGKKKYGKDGMAALAKAGREGASEEELGRIKDKYKKEGFEIGDDFGISFTEEFEIGTEIVDLAEDGIVIELDDHALAYLEQQGFTFDEIELGERLDTSEKINASVFNKATKSNKYVELAPDVYFKQSRSIWDEHETSFRTPSGEYGYATHMHEGGYPSLKDIYYNIKDHNSHIKDFSDAYIKSIASVVHTHIKKNKLNDVDEGFELTEEATNHLQMAKHHEVIAKEMNRIEKEADDEDDELYSGAAFEGEEFHRTAAQLHRNAHKTKSAKDSREANDYTRRTIDHGETHHFTIKGKGGAGDYGHDFSILHKRFIALQKGLGEEGDLAEEKQKGLDGKACWKGYRRMGTKMKGGKRVDNCVKVSEGEEDIPAEVEAAIERFLETNPKDGDDLQAFHHKAIDDRNKDLDDYLSDLYDYVAVQTGAGGTEELGVYDEMLDMLYQMIADKGWKDDRDIDEAEYQGRKVPLGKPMAGDVKKSKVYVRKPNGKVVKVNFGDKKMRIKKSNPNRRKSFRARHNCKNPGPRWKARYWSCRAW